MNETQHKNPQPNTSPDQPSSITETPETEIPETPRLKGYALSGQPEHNTKIRKRCWVLMLLLIGIILLAVIAALIFMLVESHTEEAQPDEAISTSTPQMTDAQRFKSEYEALNHTTRESDSATYNDVTIDENNPIVYINAAEALDILDQDAAIIYVGAEWCPWCRNAVPILLDVARQHGTDKIYYLNLDQEKSNYTIEDGEPKQTKAGTADYYALLKKLETKLEDYIITDANGVEYRTGEKRIYQPHVFAIKDGAIVDDKSGTVELNPEQTKYDDLTSEQKSQLKSVYDRLFAAVYGEQPLTSCSTTDTLCD